MESNNNDYIRKLGEVADKIDVVANAAYPTSTSIGSPVSEDIKKHITKENLTKMVDQLTENPDTIESLIGEMPTTFSEEMVNKVKSVISPQQAEKLRKQMEDSGIDPQMMRSQMMQKRNDMLGRTLGKESNKTVVIVRTNRKLATRELPINREKLLESISAILKTKDYTEMTLSKVTLFYDPNEKIINSRIKKLTDIKIGGDVICVTDDSFTEEAYIKFETAILNF